MLDLQRVRDVHVLGRLRDDRGLVSLVSLLTDIAVIFMIAVTVAARVRLGGSGGVAVDAHSSGSGSGRA